MPSRARIIGYRERRRVVRKGAASLDVDDDLAERDTGLVQEGYTRSGAEAL